MSSLISSRTWGLLWAGLLFLCSGSIAIYAYARILDKERPESALIGSIPDGKHRYQLLSQGKIVADLETSMEFKDDQYVYEGSGSLTLSFLGKTFSPSMSIRANFNPIGQMGGLVVRIRGEGIYANFGGVNINPIQLRAKVIINNKEQLQYSATVPGPITLSQNRDKSFRLEYLNFGHVVKQFSSVANHPALRASQIELRECFVDKECGSNERGALDTSAFILPLMGAIK